MSTAPKPNLRAVNFAEVAKVVTEHAQEQGIKTLVKTGAAAPAADSPEPEPTAAKPPAPPTRKGKGSKPDNAAAQSPVRRLAIDLPTYLIAEIRQRALTEETTIRFVITRALTKDKFKVEPQDLIEDGRREH